MMAGPLVRSLSSMRINATVVLVMMWCAGMVSGMNGSLLVPSGGSGSRSSLSSVRSAPTSVRSSPSVVRSKPSSAGRSAPSSSRSSPSSVLRSNPSTGSPRPSYWTRFFRRVNLDNRGSLYFPETFDRNLAISLLDHLKYSYKDLKKYNNGLCKVMDGRVFSVIIGLAQEAEYRKSSKRRLLGYKCIRNIPVETWSVLSKSQVNNLAISITDIPAPAVSYLLWDVFKAAVTNHWHKQNQQPISYNGWCRHIQPHQFSREIWTGDLWHVLTSDCVADMLKSKSRIGAVRLIAEIDLSRLNIGRPDLVDLSQRLIRLLTIKRAIINKGKKAYEYVQKRIAQLVFDLEVLFEENTKFLETANRKEILLQRCSMMDRMLKFMHIGAGAATVAEDATNLLEMTGEIDPLSVFTWEAISKLAVKNPSMAVVDLISNLVSSMNTRRLPIDSLLDESCRNSSVAILLTIIDKTKNWKMLNAIRDAVKTHNKQLSKYNARELYARISNAKFPPKVITSN